MLWAGKQWEDCLSVRHGCTLSGFEQVFFVWVGAPLHGYTFCFALNDAVAMGYPVGVSMHAWTKMKVDSRHLDWQPDLVSQQARCVNDQSQEGAYKGRDPDIWVLFDECLDVTVQLSL